MCDMRVPLDAGTVVLIGDNNYAILGVKSYEGGSCIVYDAERKPTSFENSIGLPSIPAVVKEFYPKEMAAALLVTRHLDELIVSLNGQSEFKERRKIFTDGAVKQVRFYGEGSTHSLAPSRIGKANNTVYSAVDSAIGEPLNKVAKKLQPYELVEVMESLAEAVTELHDKNLLHLDIKPSNVFLFANKGVLSYRVALFDFDTVLTIEEAQSGEYKIGVSEGWSAPEQGTKDEPPKYKKLSKVTDVYALGAILYWAVTGTTVTDDVLSKVMMDDFDFLDCIADDSVRESVQDYLSETLQRFPEDRAKITERGASECQM